MQQGTRVKHLFKSDDPEKEPRWYYGNILLVRDDGLFDVKFDDKSLELGMEASELVLVRERKPAQQPETPNPEPKPLTKPTDDSSLSSENEMEVEAVEPSRISYDEKLKIIPAMPPTWKCLECWAHFHDDSGKEKAHRPPIDKAHKVCIEPQSTQCFIFGSHGFNRFFVIYVNRCSFASFRIISTFRTK
jgi:hypothetical protein